MVGDRAQQGWRGALRTVGTDAAVVVTGVVTYFGVRGMTAGSPDVAREHADDVLALEKTLGLDVEAGVQALLVDVAPLTTLANWVYIWGHWPVIAGVFVWLALHDRTVFLRLRNAMIASGGLGLCVYTTYPVAPPRLAGRGFVDTITEQSSSYRVLQPPAFVNQYAAMPSLHVGWDLCVGLALVAAASTLTVRTIGRLMPVVMAAATVLTANHYVLDVIAGAAFGLAGWAIALRVERRRERRAAAAGGAQTAGAVAAPAAVDLRVPAQRPGSDGAGVDGPEAAEAADRRCAEAP
jgi:membrane-associated phospholipid phosphatase